MMKYKNQLMVVGLCVVFFGCSKYASHPYVLAPCSADSTWTPLRKNTLISSKYCELFVPSKISSEKLTLAELVDIALRNSPETKQTWQEARAAAANYGQSLSDYYPEAKFDASYTRLRQTFFNTILFIPFYLTVVDPRVSLSYTIFDFGKRKYSSMSALQSLYYADWLHNQQIQRILQTVINDYYFYILQKNLLCAGKADLENAEVALDAARTRFEVGLAAIGDVAQARSTYLQAKIRVTNQKTAIEFAYSELAKNLGLPSNITFDVVDLPTKTNVNIPIENVDTLVQRAQKNRQDFLAARANVKSKKAKVKEAKAESRPTITGEFELGRNYYNKGVHEDYNFTAQVSLNIPLFKGFFFRNGVRVAKANLEKSKAQLMGTELQIVQEVTNSHRQVEGAAENVVDAEEYLTSAQEQFAIALSNYKVGTGTILDVISAQSSLADARTRLAASKSNWYSSLVNLAYSTGCLCNAHPTVELEEIKNIYSRNCEK